jgi:uncharacterized protein YcbK (DUF882 family)
VATRSLKLRVRSTSAFALGAAVIAISGLALGEPNGSKSASRAPAPKRANAQAVPASRGWHTPVPGKTPSIDDKGRALLVLQALNIPDRVELAARTDRGGFSAEDLDRAAHVMRDGSGNEHPIDPRLLDMVYRLQTHFKAHEVRIISGYRTPRRAGATSNHGKGRAMDLVVPGASDEDVAKFARDEGFAGVGVYPVSGFVHVDVRERSYFWVDTSGPGKRSRIRGILADLAAKSDGQALARGEKSVGPFHLGTDVDAAIGAASAASQASAPVPDEDDEGDAVSAP